MKKILSILLLLAFALVPILTASNVQAAPTYSIVVLRPLDNRNVFYGGSVMDVKIQVLDSKKNPVTDATVTLKTQVNGAPPINAIGRGSFNTGNVFTLKQGTYIFKLDTSSLPAGAGSTVTTLLITATIDGTTVTADPIAIALH